MYDETFTVDPTLSYNPTVNNWGNGSGTGPIRGTDGINGDAYFECFEYVAVSMTSTKLLTYAMLLEILSHKLTFLSYNAVGTKHKSGYRGSQFVTVFI